MKFFSERGSSENQPESADTSDAQRPPIEGGLLFGGLFDPKGTGERLRSILATPDELAEGPRKDRQAIRGDFERATENLLGKERYQKYRREADQQRSAKLISELLTEYAEGQARLEKRAPLEPTEVERVEDLTSETGSPEIADSSWWSISRLPKKPK